MGCLGNLLWFIFGGALSGLSWCLAGCLWCITIIGIPVGMQCFKFAGLSFFPFGKEVQYGGGAGSFLLNILWLILSGLPLAIEHCVLGILKSRFFSCRVSAEKKRDFLRDCKRRTIV